MLKKSSLAHLKNRKNLLAFSAGGDSTALFFLLLKKNIKFDIAIVNYATREQSVDEVLYAQELAKKYDLKCYVHKAADIQKNFEANAREIRYSFFKKLIDEHQYQVLLTAHHLGDRFEWMLMQFCKGAGCVELSGMKEFQEQDSYTLVRPLLHLDKQELLQYLDTHKIKYFKDETNNDTTIKRNMFRHLHTQPLLQNHLEGIKKSFIYMDEDRESLVQEITVQKHQEFTYFQNSYNPRTTIYTIDKYLKSQGHMMSAQERLLLTTDTTVIIGREFIVNQNKEFVFIAPYITDNITMDKSFKEECRELKIDPKLRKYFFQNREIFSKVKEIYSNHSR